MDIRNYFRNPKILFSRESRREFLTTSTLAIITVLDIFFLGFVIFYYSQSQDASGFPYFIIVGIVSGAAWYASAKGFWSFVNYVPILLFYSIGIYGSIIVGYRTAFVVYYVIAFMLAGLLINKRSMVFWSFICVTTHIAVSLINQPLTIKEFLEHVIPLTAGFAGVLSLQLLHLILSDNSFRQSFVDPVTQVQNRSYFEAMLSTLQKSRFYPISILIVDIDDLKYTNDSMGHSFGDMLIKRTSDCLRSACRADDVICRIGGDEFAIVFQNTNENTLLNITIRISEQMQQDNQSHPELPLHFSVGTATAKHKNSLLETLKLADTRMYSNKRAYKNSLKILSGKIKNAPNKACT